MNSLNNFYDEDEIMSSFREGNKESFRLIFEKMARPLTYFVENIIHSLADSEDIVANSFYKLYNARTSMQSYEHVKRWLYVIVRNAAVDHLRFQIKKRESKTYLSYFEKEFTETQIETERIKALLFQNILQEIEDLPKQRKKILRLYFFEQKTTQEIAEIMNLNSQTVLNHKAKALESLRKTSFDKKYNSIYFY